MRSGGVNVAVGASGTTSYTNANGTYTFRANGAWSFDPVVQTSVFPVHDDFTYTITDGDGSRQPSENELAGARYQGAHVARIAAKLAA